MKRRDHFFENLITYTLNFMLLFELKILRDTN